MLKYFIIIFMITCMGISIFLEFLNNKTWSDLHKINDEERILKTQQIKNLIMTYKITALQYGTDKEIIEMSIKFFLVDLSLCYDSYEFEKLQKRIEREIERVKVENTQNYRSNFHKSYDSNSIKELEKDFLILNIDYTEDITKIKSAYKILIKKYHPDLNPNDKTALENTKKINEAYANIKKTLNFC